MTTPSYALDRALLDELTEPGFRLPAAGIDLESLEKDLIRQALDQARGNKTRAAALLGLTRDTLRYRLEKYGISDVSPPT